MGLQSIKISWIFWIFEKVYIQQNYISYEGGIVLTDNN